MQGKWTSGASRSHGSNTADVCVAAGSSVILGAPVSISGVMNKTQIPAELMRQQQGSSGPGGSLTPLVGILTKSMGPETDTVTNKVFGLVPRAPSCLSSRIRLVDPR